MIWFLDSILPVTRTIYVYKNIKVYSYPISNTGISGLSPLAFVLCNAQGSPPWILKRVGLESYGQRLISWYSTQKNVFWEFGFFVNFYLCFSDFLDIFLLIFFFVAISWIFIFFRIFVFLKNILVLVFLTF